MFLIWDMCVRPTLDPRDYKKFVGIPIPRNSQKCDDFTFLFCRGRLGNVQSLQPLCHAIVLFLRSFVSPRSCCRCRSGFHEKQE